MKGANYTGAPSSYYHVDASLLPDNVQAKDLFAIRFGLFSGLSAGFDIDPRDILIVWTKPDRLHPGMIVMERAETAPVCRQVNMDSEPGPKVVGQVIALLRPLK